MEQEQTSLEREIRLFSSRLNDVFKINPIGKVPTRYGRTAADIVNAIYRYRFWMDNDEQTIIKDIMQDAGLSLESEEAVVFSDILVGIINAYTMSFSSNGHKTISTAYAESLKIATIVGYDLKPTYQTMPTAHFKLALFAISLIPLLSLTNVKTDLETYFESLLK